MESVSLQDAADPGQQMIVAAAKRRPHLLEDAKRAKVETNLGERRPHQRTDEHQTATALTAKQLPGPAEFADRNPVMAKARRALRVADAAQCEQDRRDAAS